MKRAVFVLSLLSGVAAVSAQTVNRPQSAPAFEVASVKPGDPAMKIPGFRVTPSGQWFAQNSTVAEIIGRAFPDFAFRGAIVGGPRWAHETRFTIDARAAGPAPLADLQAMARHLLADRFKLRTHVEQRSVDVYALVVAREDRRLGRGLRPSSAECIAARAAIPRNAFPPECPSDSGQLPTGTRISERGWLISQLVAMVQTWMDRRIIDRTDLTGRYDMDFEFDFSSVKGVEVAGATAASIFTAFQDHLGLKLESRREPMDVLVIDSVEMPTAD